MDNESAYIALRVVFAYLRLPSTIPPFTAEITSFIVWQCSQSCNMSYSRKQPPQMFKLGG